MGSKVRVKRQEDRNRPDEKIRKEKLKAKKEGLKKLKGKKGSAQLLRELCVITFLVFSTYVNNNNNNSKRNKYEQQITALNQINMTRCYFHTFAAVKLTWSTDTRSNISL